MDIERYASGSSDSSEESWREEDGVKIWRRLLFILSFVVEEDRIFYCGRYEGG